MKKVERKPLGKTGNRVVNVITGIILVGLVIGVIAIIATAVHGVKHIATHPFLTTKTATTSQATKPATTKPTTTEVTPTTTATTAPAASTAPKVLLDQSGNGIASTAPFITGNKWTITYTFDCSSFGSQGNFQIYINNTDGSENDDAGANQLATSGGSTDYYYDAGSHSLQINSECDWHVTVNG
jgi:hypothetical protein